MGWFTWVYTMLRWQWRLFFRDPIIPKKKGSRAMVTTKIFPPHVFDRSAYIYYMSCINKYIDIYINIIYILIHITSLYAYLITLPFEETNLNGFVASLLKQTPTLFCWPGHSIAPNARAGLGFGKPPWKCPEKKLSTPKQIPKKAACKTKSPKTLKSKNAWNTKTDHPGWTAFFLAYC